MIYSTFEKYEGEAFTIEVDFVASLPSGASISSGAIELWNKQGESVTLSVVASATATVSTTKLRANLIAGTKKGTYKGFFKATLDNGNFLNEKVVIKVLGL